MKNRKCIVGEIIFCMIFACLVLCLLNCYSEENNRGVDRATIMMERAKKAHEYDKWAGIVEFPDKEVNNLEIGEEFFERFSKEIKIYTPVKDRERDLDANLKSKKNDVIVNVRTTYTDSPTAAKKLILNFMASSSFWPALKRYDTNDPNLFYLKGPNEPNLPKIGDVCFVPPYEWKPENSEKNVLSLIMFTRNNVSVSLRIDRAGLSAGDAEECPNLLEMAQLIDERLKASLVPKNSQQPAPPPK